MQGKNKTGVNKGQWYGPATVLGTETNEENGVRRPAAVIWVVVNNRLWRCAPQQLRKASGREVAMEELRQRRPWTFENIVKDIAIGEYADIQGEAEPDQAPNEEEEEEGEPGAPEIPDLLDEWDMDEEPPVDMEDAEGRPRMHQKRQAEREPEEPVPRQRLRTKTTPVQAVEAVDWEVMLAQATASAKRALHQTESGFFNNVEDFPEVVLQIEFPELTNSKQIRKYLKNPEAFVVTSLRKKRVEVNEKRMTPEERESMNMAKGKEIREFIKEAVVTRLLKDEKVNPKDVMKMRFVLTWKSDPDSKLGKRGKARLVVLGFQDPYLGKEETTSPTLNRRSKQLILQQATQKRWRLRKGDVTAAFLQGKKLTKSKYCLAPEELAEALGMPPGERVVRLLKSVYGLTAAPLEWYKEVNEVLIKLGAKRCETDPCVWVFVDEEELIGIIGAHVDDFLIAGEETSEKWNSIIKLLLAAFRWTPWEEGEFKQCGVNIKQLDDFSFEQDQSEYLQGLDEIPIRRERAQEKDALVTEYERSQLRAVLGGLQWLVGQTRLDGMVDVNLLQSQVTRATVQTLQEANKALRKLKTHANLKLYIRYIEGEVVCVVWSDASWANRSCGSSTGGYLLGLCSREVLNGKKSHVTVASWSTNKLKRVARSSLAAEVQALAVAEDELHLTRAAWFEMNGGTLDLNNPDDCIKQITGVAVVDAKSIYDTLNSQTQPLQLAEKRTALELLAYLRNTQRNGTITRWVHGGANLADAMTKLGATAMLWEFLKTSEWSIVFDENQMSGKKRKAEGLGKLDNTQVSENGFYNMALKRIQEFWPMFGKEESESEEEAISDDEE